MSEQIGSQAKITAAPESGLVHLVAGPARPPAVGNCEAATLIQMAISRAREFLADEAAATASGKSLALAGALRKIESCSQRLPMNSGSPATAHLFIQNPFAGGDLL